MATIADSAAYICSKTKSMRMLSKARLTKLLYLADWASAVNNGNQVTDIIWKFNHYGPYVNDVMDEIKINKNFSISNVVLTSGEFIELIEYVGNGAIDISPSEAKSLDSAIDRAAKLPYDKFLNFVYSTYPIATGTRYEMLPLVELAKMYRKEMQAISINK